MVPEELNVQRVNSVLLMFPAVQSVGASNSLACSESTVVCSLDFFFFFSLDILILALGDPMYKASLNIRSPRFHLATYC